MSNILGTIESELVCPYSGLIEQALAMEFPRNIQVPSQHLLDAITEQVVSTGKVRFGPKPSPEGLVAIRQVIKAAIDVQAPIPILVPWGSKKPANDSSIDVAEVCGLRTLACLNQRIADIYSPGIHLNVRVEDVGGLYLFDDEGVEGREANNRYVSDFVKLVNVLGAKEYVHLKLESQVVTERQYFDAAYQLLPLFLAYIEETDECGLESFTQLESWQLLQSEGWVGSISTEMRNFYRSRYAKFYGSDYDDSNYRLAKYLAGSLARYQLGATGANPEWDRYIKITFAPAVPGDPCPSAISYRTIPACYTRDHLPPWRGKGFYRISEDNITPAVTSAWSEMPLDNHRVVLKGHGDTVEVQTDFMIV